MTIGFLPLAADIAQPTPSGVELYMPLLTFLPMIVVIYFVLIRPQNKERKRLESLRTSLKPGDEIALSSGILGRIIKIEPDFVVLQVATNVNIRVLKSAVEARVGQNGDSNKSS